jgi:hypothetical protein
MKNEDPIFINSFARGGSTILMNLLLSHPKVCSSNGEIQKVFKGTRWDSVGMKIYKKICCDLPIRLIVRQDIFSLRLLKKRKRVPLYARNYIDKILYEGRFKASLATHNLLKDEQTPYTIEELAKCRLLMKGLNGLVFNTQMFSEMYPDATFIALIRNGLALCESYIRRGQSAKQIAEMYNIVINKILENSKYIPNYHIVKFEDMINDPDGFTKKIFKFANLDSKQVKKIRQQTRKTIDENGRHVLTKGSKERQVLWYYPKELKTHMSMKVNYYQIKNLSQHDKKSFLSIAGEAMEKVGYSLEN